ncbi:unnamed protein product [Prunus brigantina]
MICCFISIQIAIAKIEHVDTSSYVVAAYTTPFSAIFSHPRRKPVGRISAIVGSNCTHVWLGGFFMMAATLGIKECGFGIILFGGGQQPLKEDIMVLWFGSAATHMGKLSKE